jgi:hypothetical protein
MQEEEEEEEEIAGHVFLLQRNKNGARAKGKTTYIAN